MYSVYADDICIYNDSFMLEDAIIIDPHLTLEANAAGSFEFTLPSTNKVYATAERLKTEISVRRDGSEIWAGRIVSEEKDFWNNRKLYCEGELAFLNDTTQPMAEYHENYMIDENGTRHDDFHTTVTTFLGRLLENHNTNVSSDKQFTLGTVTVHDKNDGIYRYTNYEKTIECINDKLLDKFGGYLIIRKENGVRYLDYLDEENATTTNTQVIDFGVNLMDFVRSWKSDEYATVIVPLGERLETSHIEALEEYQTIKNATSSPSPGNVRNGKYLYNSNAVAAFGWIEKVVHWDDVSVPNNLLSKADSYLNDLQFDTMMIELSALDLHYLNHDAQAINLYDNVLVKSVPHGLVGENGDGKLFPVTKLEIPLDNPSDTLFTLGTDMKTSLTDVNNKTNASILQKIENSKTSVLDEAKKDASDVMNHKFTGYVTVVNDDETGVANAIYISNTPDYRNTSTLWRWNMAGLGYTRNYSPTGTPPPTWETAITMDGKIVADFITAGTMAADRIRGGSLVSTNGNVNFDLTNGTLTMNAGSINIADKFIVYANGNLSATNADVKGTFFAGSDNSYWVELSSNGKLVGGNGNNTYGSMDFTVEFHDPDTQQVTYHGTKLQTDLFVIGVEKLGVKDHNDSSAGHYTKSGQLTVVLGVQTDGHGSVTNVTTGTLTFRHGMLTSSPPLDPLPSN